MFRHLGPLKSQYYSWKLEFTWLLGPNPLRNLQDTDIKSRNYKNLMILWCVLAICPMPPTNDSLWHKRVNTRGAAWLGAYGCTRASTAGRKGRGALGMHKRDEGTDEGEVGAVRPRKVNFCYDFKVLHLSNRIRYQSYRPKDYKDRIIDPEASIKTKLNKNMRFYKALWKVEHNNRNRCWT